MHSGMRRLQELASVWWDSSDQAVLQERQEQLLQELASVWRDSSDQAVLQERQEQQQPAYAGPRTEYAPPPPQGGRGGYSDWQDSRAGGYQGSYEPQDSASRSYAEYWPVEDPAGELATNNLAET